MNYRFIVLLVFLLAIATSGFAQGALSGSIAPEIANPEPSPNTYGTLSETVYTIGAWSFEGYDSATTTVGFGSSRYVTAGWLEGPVNLPNGALVTSMEIEGCDTTAGGSVAASFLVCPDVGSGCTDFGTASSGSAATPGCGRFLRSFSPAIQINNSNQYLIQVFTGTTAATRFGPVRIRYKLQVSPAPVSATFTDVPTSHPFFQYIEALAAAGVTAGCVASPPQYCPDAPVTRGQMAVFLSRALGLHFPN